MLIVYHMRNVCGRICGEYVSDDPGLREDAPAPATIARTARSEQWHMGVGKTNPPLAPPWEGGGRSSALYTSSEPALYFVDHGEVVAGVAEGEAGTGDEDEAIAGGAAALLEAPVGDLLERVGDVAGERHRQREHAPVEAHLPQRGFGIADADDGVGPRSLHSASAVAPEWLTTTMALALRSSAMRAAPWTTAWVMGSTPSANLFGRIVTLARSR